MRRGSHRQQRHRQADVIGKAAAAIDQKLDALTGRSAGLTDALYADVRFGLRCVDERE
jgi:hypothetical protein